MNKLEKFLLKKYIITEHELGQVEAIHEQTGSEITDIILSEGYTSPYKLYQAIAEFKGLEFVDLQKNPCDVNIIDINDRDIYRKLKAIPWKKDGDTIVIATCNDSEDLNKWAEGRFTNYRLAITTNFDIHDNLNRLFEAENNMDALESLWKIHPYYSAKNLFAGIQSKIFVIALLIILPMFIIFPVQTLPFLFIVLACFYTATLTFKAMLFIIGMLRRERVMRHQGIIDMPAKNLPVYTILVPLYKEEKTLKKLTKAIKEIDYPRSKLDVKLIVEADDNITIEAIKELKCERMFEMIKVPYSLPRTKPKACNYALKFAKGEYVTIYDAEDIPDPKQLKKVLYAFANAGADVACVQAKLNYFNREENLLTRLFSIEYSTLFDFMLFGLEAMQIPVPLGGTSNHFRVETLNELYAWDPYNVTEDADLGIRIAQKGWKCTVIDSLTMEESPITIKAWIRQRSRWIKGHMQTYFVHMRHPLTLYKQVGIVGFMGVQFFLGAPALIFLISPVMWVVWLLFMLGIIHTPPDMPLWFNDVVYFSLLILFAGIILHGFYAVIAIICNKWKGMFIYSLVFPFYWILHSIASFKALWQLITRPYYWEKTNHGVSKV